MQDSNRAALSHVLGSSVPQRTLSNAALENAIAAAVNAPRPRHSDTFPPRLLWPGEELPRAPRGPAQIDYRCQTSTHHEKMTPNERSHVDRGQAQAAYSALDVEASGKSPRESSGRRPRRGPFQGRRPIEDDSLRRSRWHPHVLCHRVVLCRFRTHQSVVVLLLGACNILADAMAMGVGEYLSTKSSDEYARARKSQGGLGAPQPPRGRGRGDG